MKLGLILVTYAHHPRKLIESVSGTDHELRWYVHHHGDDPAFCSEVEAVAAGLRADLSMHRVNRGLSRSWNDGLHKGYEDGNDVCLLLNDDLFFVDDGFRRFVAFIEEEKNASLLFCRGLETGGSPYAGQVEAQGFACCGIKRSALAAVGYFDEAFVPAYYEDIDFNRRCILAGVKAATMSEICVEHERAATSREVPGLREVIQAAIHRNLEYYVRKWGGFPHQESHAVPFGDPNNSIRIDWSDRADPYGELPT